MDFLPDSAQYSCYNQVEFYNKVVVTFYNLNMPLNRLKLTSVDYGYGTWFEADNLRNVKLIQEINPISTEISINTVDFVLDIKTDKEFLFQKKQPLEIYFNGELKATTFVRNFKRKSKNLWDIQTDDYIGLLDGVYFYGGLYSSKKAVDILTEIFEVAKVPYVVDDIFEDELVTGYIPYTTCRQALMQVAFAIQAAVDTSNSDIVKIFALDNTTSQSVPLSRIMQGQSFQDEESITGVELTAHAYTPISNIVKVYDAKESGIGENVFVKFSEPLHDLSITNGEIVDFGTNYAVINADSGCQLNGQKYDHATRTKRKNNPLVLANDIPKIVAIENATLISASNIDKVLEKCYNYLVITNQVNLDIVENKNNDPVNVGDLINVETEYSGDVNGRVIKQSFNLNGGIIIKKTTMRGTI
jgi:hypothetical protein